MASLAQGETGECRNFLPLVPAVSVMKLRSHNQLAPPGPCFPSPTRLKKLFAANTLRQPRIFNLMVSRVSLLQKSQPCYIGSSRSAACPRGN